MESVLVAVCVFSVYGRKRKNTRSLELYPLVETLGKLFPKEP